MKKRFASVAGLPAFFVCWLLLSGPAALAQAISSFAPTTGVAGTAVTITGTGFSAVTSVRFNGVQAASFAAANATTITAVVPTGATTGVISISNGVGTVSSTASFVVQQPATRSVVVDGYRETAYGTALALQAAATGFGNAVNGDPVTALMGSELDAAYAYVSQDSLHVFLAGNLESNGNELDIFIDSQTGGQNVLTARVGGGGLTYDNLAGLTFDTGFTADYHFRIDDGVSVIRAQILTITTGVFETDANGPGRYTVVPLPGGRTGRVSINNSNTGGVNDATVGVGWPAAVVTGVEFVLPLPAIGSPTGSLKIAAMVNSQAHDYLSNQVLGSLPAGTANLGNPMMVNYNTYAGLQYFTVNVPAAGTVPTITSVSPGTGAVGTTITITGTNLTGATSVSFNGTGATGYTVNGTGTSLTVTVPAGATTGTISVTTANGTATSSGSFAVTGATSSVTAIAPTSGVAGTAVTITGTGFTGTTAVTFNGTTAASFTVVSATSILAVVPAGATTGLISITGGGAVVTSATPFTVDQPHAGHIVSDGYRESLYGAALALQTTPTGFGNATNGDQTTALNGSELDAAYARVSGDSLYVFVAGNLENNGNALDVFFDSQTGGQNVLTATNPTVDGNALGTMAGLQFDAGFAADYYLTIKTNGAGTTPLAASFATLGTGGASVASAATGTGRAVALTLGSGRTGALALDNANTGGVNDTNIPTGSPATVVRGLEFVLPLAALGSPTGSLKVAAFVNNGAHDYLSNQVLAGLPAGTTNLMTASAVNFASPANAGNQFFVVNIPPTLTAFTPNSGVVGSTIGLTGTGLTGATSITFTGASGNVVTTGFTVNPAGTGITGIVVPAGATTGTVTVTNANGTSTGVTFTVTAPQLAVTQGAAAYTNNGAAYAFGAQTVGTTSAPVTFSLNNAGTAPLSITSISVTGPFALTGMTLPSVPAGGSTNVQVTFTPTGSGAQAGTLVIVSSLGTYTVNLSGNSSYPVPTVSGISPSSGPVGTVVTVTGTGFTATGTSVSLNGTAVAGATVNAGGTAVTFTVPAGATAGSVAVTTLGGAATSTPSFCVQYTPTATAVAICGSGPATLSTSGAPAGGSYTYYTSATGGTAIGTGASFTTPSISATTTYYVAVATGLAPTSCEGPRTAVVATVNALPTAPTAAPVSVCGSGPATLTAAGGAAGGTYAYYTTATGGTAIVGASGATYTIPSLTATTTYYVSTINSNGCESPRTAVLATVNAVPTAPAAAPVNVCGSGAATITATGGATGGTYAYYTSATGGTAIAGASGATYTTPSLTATTTYYVSTISSSGCESPRTAVTATVNAAPTAPTAAPASVCGSGTVALTATGGPTGGTYAYYAAAIGGTSLGGATGSFTTPSLTATTTYYVSAISATGCESPRTAVVATVNATPATPTLTYTTILTTPTVTGATYQYFLNGVAVTGATAATYTPTQSGSYTVVVTSAAGCASPASAATVVTITGTAKAAAPEAFQVFPNPARSTATVQVPALTSAATLTLRNALGQVVRTHTLAPAAAPSRLTLDLQGMAAGVYLVRVQAPGSAAFGQRLVVE